MNIQGLNKDEVLAALFNASKQQGMGFLHAAGASAMSVEEACAILDAHSEAGRRPYFDYLKGRVMKIDLSKDEVNTALYDRDNGQGAAEAAIAHLTAK